MADDVVQSAGPRILLSLFFRLLIFAFFLFIYVRNLNKESAASAGPWLLGLVLLLALVLKESQSKRKKDASYNVLVLFTASSSLDYRSFILFLVVLYLNNSLYQLAKCD